MIRLGENITELEQLSKENKRTEFEATHKSITDLLKELNAIQVAADFGNILLPDFLSNVSNKVNTTSFTPQPGNIGSKKQADATKLIEQAEAAKSRASATKSAVKIPYEAYLVAQKNLQDAERDMDAAFSHIVITAENGEALQKLLWSVRQLLDLYIQHIPLYSNAWKNKQEALQKYADVLDTLIRFYGDDSDEKARLQQTSYYLKAEIAAEISKKKELDEKNAIFVQLVQAKIVANNKKITDFNTPGTKKETPSEPESKRQQDEEEQTDDEGFADAQSGEESKESARFAEDDANAGDGKKSSEGSPQKLAAQTAYNQLVLQDKELERQIKAINELNERAKITKDNKAVSEALTEALDKFYDALETFDENLTTFAPGANVDDVNEYMTAHYSMLENLQTVAQNIVGMYLKIGDRDAFRINIRNQIEERAKVSAQSGEDSGAESKESARFAEDVSDAEKAKAALYEEVMTKSRDLSTKANQLAENEGKALDLFTNALDTGNIGASNEANVKLQELLQPFIRDRAEFVMRFALLQSYEFLPEGKYAKGIAEMLTNNESWETLTKRLQTFLDHAKMYANLVEKDNAIYSQRQRIIALNNTANGSLAMAKTTKKKENIDKADNDDKAVTDAIPAFDSALALFEKALNHFAPRGESGYIELMYKNLEARKSLIAHMREEIYNRNEDLETLQRQQTAAEREQAAEAERARAAEQAAAEAQRAAAEQAAAEQAAKEKTDYDNLQRDNTALYKTKIDIAKLNRFAEDAISGFQGLQNTEEVQRARDANRDVREATDAFERRVKLFITRLEDFTKQYGNVHRQEPLGIMATNITVWQTFIKNINEAIVARVNLIVPPAQPKQEQPEGGGGWGLRNLLRRPAPQPAAAGGRRYFEWFRGPAQPAQPAPVPIEVQVPVRQPAGSVAGTGTKPGQGGPVQEGEAAARPARRRRRVPETEEQKAAPAAAAQPRASASASASEEKISHEVDAAATRLASMGTDPDWGLYWDRVNFVNNTYNQLQGEDRKRWFDQYLAPFMVKDRNAQTQLGRKSQLGRTPRTRSRGKSAHNIGTFGAGESTLSDFLYDYLYSNRYPNFDFRPYIFAVSTNLFKFYKLSDHMCENYTGDDLSTKKLWTTFLREKKTHVTTKVTPAAVLRQVVSEIRNQENKSKEMEQFLHSYDTGFVDTEGINEREKGIQKGDRQEIFTGEGAMFQLCKPNVPPLKGGHKHHHHHPHRHPHHHHHRQHHHDNIDIIKLTDSGLTDSGLTGTTEGRDEQEHKHRHRRHGEHRHRHRHHRHRVPL